MTVNPVTYCQKEPDIINYVTFRWITCGLQHSNLRSYLSAHVLMNLLNELRRRDKMEGLPSILSLFCNEFDKFNNTSARMSDFIYHMTLRLHVL